MLKHEHKYQFREKIMELHKKNIRDFSLEPSVTEYVISDGFAIVLPETDDIVVETAAKDFVDYLFTSMQICARITKNADTKNAVVLSFNKDIGEGSGYMGYRINVSKDFITIEGYDARGIAQGIYYLEDRMNIRNAPYISFGTTARRAAFNIRASQSPMGMFEYPDEVLAKMAHLGMDTVELWLKDFETDHRGYYFDVNNLCDRAEKYGLNVVVEFYTPHSVNAADAGAEAFYDNIYGELFRQCPKIWGVEFLGEATKYKSYDPNLAKPRGEEFEKIPRSDGKAGSSGWWPCNDYPAFFELVLKIIRRVKSDAQLILYTYNWMKAPDEERLRLIRELPQDVIVMGAWDMYQQFRIGEESMEVVADYSLRFTEPSDKYRIEAEEASKRGMTVYSLANSSGFTWDFGVIPYEPALYQWIKKYECLLKARDDMNLSGLFENIHYGFYPSIVNDLEKEMFFLPSRPGEEILQELIVRDFGEENAELVNNAFKKISEAITHYVPTNEDQYGAFRMGPAYPLWSDLYEGWPNKFPTPPKHAAHKGIAFSMYWQDFQLLNSLPGIRVFDEIEELNIMDDYLLSAVADLELCEAPNEAVLRLLNLVRFMHCNIHTVCNVKKHYILKQELSICKTRKKATEILDSMEKILRAERENVERTIPLVQVDSRLGWEPSMEYVCDEKALRWKLNQLDYELAILDNRYRKEIF